jgi:hypothetical protein
MLIRPGGDPETDLTDAASKVNFPAGCPYKQIETNTSPQRRESDRTELTEDCLAEFRTGDLSGISVDHA